MNSIVIAGRIGQAPEMRHLPDGTPVLSLSVADDQGKDKPPIWWRASIFGKRAEALQPYLQKGGAVTVVGTVTERTWTDKDGQQRKAMDVRVQEIALQGGRPSDSVDDRAPKRTPVNTTSARPSDRYDDDGVPF